MTTTSTSAFPAARNPAVGRPHLIYLAIGFPPAAKSSTHRLCETANQFAALGWDVTVVNAGREHWRLDHGIDESLLGTVDPRVRMVELPLVRPDLQTDIRTFSKTRALDPIRWHREYLRKSQRAFPEPHYGAWKTQVHEAVRAIHAEHPADLVLATCVPYMLQAVAHQLWSSAGVPYAVDYRDGWSIDVVTGDIAFAPDSGRGRLEAEYLTNAVSLWVVNEPIADHYRRRYPELAGRIHVVRNGFDQGSQPPPPQPATHQGPVQFGYVGTVNFTSADLRTVLEAWRTARRTDPVLADARLELAGHIGAGSNREATGHLRVLREFADDGVAFLGPVPKAEISGLYQRWDALLLILIGGRYVTSGKVYEFMASGLPIASAHPVDHDASTLLAGYPLWAGPAGLDTDELVAVIGRAARLALDAGATERLAARDYAATYERSQLMHPAVAALSAAALPPRSPIDRSDRS